MSRSMVNSEAHHLVMNPDCAKCHDTRGGAMHAQLRQIKMKHWEREKLRIKATRSIGLSDKIGTTSVCAGVWNEVWSEIGTFRTPRYVTVKNWYLAGIWWFMCALTMVYAFYAVFKDFQYLAKTFPVVNIGGYAEIGSMYSPNNPATPIYCSLPNNRDYYVSREWNYANIGCAYYAMADIYLKRTPTYNFFTTFLHERTQATGNCASSTSCHGNTSGVTEINGWCSCLNKTNTYVMYPEGMEMVFTHDVWVDFPSSGNNYWASSTGLSHQDTASDTKELTTILVAANGSVIQTWHSGQEIRMKLGHLLEIANIDLDTFNYFAPKDPQTHNHPYWRMTGATLAFDLEYTNYDVYGIREDYQEHDAKVFCVITLSHVGSWESVGHDAVDFKSQISYTSRPGTSVRDYETVLVDRYRQGIRVTFGVNGSLGEVDLYAIMNTILNSVVLMSIATYIVTLIAKYASPCEGFGAIFRKYQDTSVKPAEMIARTASVAAVRVGHIMKIFDPQQSGIVDPRILYENLSVMFGDDLNQAQIAQLVTDITNNADIDKNGNIAIDEFAQFIQNDECDLLNVIDKYKEKDGDVEMLRNLLDTEDKTLGRYLSKLHATQKHLHQLHVANSKGAWGEQSSCCLPEEASKRILFARTASELLNTPAQPLYSNTNTRVPSNAAETSDDSDTSWCASTDETELSPTLIMPPASAQL